MGIKKGKDAADDEHQRSPFPVVLCYCEQALFLEFSYLFECTLELAVETLDGGNVHTLGG